MQYFLKFVRLICIIIIDMIENRLYIKVAENMGKEQIKYIDESLFEKIAGGDEQAFAEL